MTITSKATLINNNTYYVIYSTNHYYIEDSDGKYYANVTSENNNPEDYTETSISLPNNLYDTLYDNLYYCSGDTYNPTGNGATHYILNGYITGSNCLVHIPVVLPKIIPENISIEISECTGYLRGISGYLNSTGYVITDFLETYDVSASYVFTNTQTFILKINYDSAFSNTTNNTPITAEFTTFCCTFT